MKDIIFGRKEWHDDQGHWAVIGGLTLLAIWALWIGRAYLDLDTDVVPAGREYGSAIQAHHLWTRIKECGICALWDGSERGGFPAFVDMLSSLLHPLVAVTTLAFGVVNGSKIALIVALWLGGVAQFWLARQMRLRWLAQVWSGMVGVAAGHLTGRMELGIFSMVLSTAMAAFVFPAFLTVVQSGKRRSTIVLAVVLAMSIVAGQGYVQAGLLFLAPAFLILLLDRELHLRLFWREYAIAMGLAVLLAAIFLVPLLHFWPHFLKDSDPHLRAMQPLRYFVLNLVIGETAFLASEALQKLPYPHLYTMYVGWIPVLLAVLCLKLGHPEDRRTLSFLTASILLAVLTGSGVTVQLLRALWPGVAALRYAPMIGGLAVPPLLGLAAYALDKLLAIDWPQLNLTQFSWKLELDLKWLLIIPLFISLSAVHDFSQNWLAVKGIETDTYELLRALRTPSLQWVQPIYGAHYFVEPAVDMGLKLSPGIMTWRWKDRPFPEPYLVAKWEDEPSEGTQVATAGDAVIYRFEDRQYASVQLGEKGIPCRAYGTGGDLLVECSNDETGQLVVRENNWSGWYAWRDGKRVALRDSRWLSVNAPSGTHEYRFRYLPWDVPLGVLLTLIGVALCTWQWIKNPWRQSTAADCEKRPSDCKRSA